MFFWNLKKNIKYVFSNTVGQTVGRIKHVWFRPTVCPTGRTKRFLGVYTFRSSVRRSDEAFTRYDRRTDQSDRRSVRPVGPTIGTCKRPLMLHYRTPPRLASLPSLPRPPTVARTDRSLTSSLEWHWWFCRCLRQDHSSVVCLRFDVTNTGLLTAAS